MRYELIGSGMSPAKIPGARTILAQAGATNIREAYTNGWRNQPRTLRFNAPDDETAKRIGDAVDLWNNALQTLGGGGGLIRAYGTHWREYGK